VLARFAIPLTLAMIVMGAPTVSGLEIWEIQGAGLRSPYENQTVSTANNTVTAVGPGLFFMQTPDTRADGDPWTSDGVMVEVAGAPSVGVGDRVSVTGTVVERYDQTVIGDVASLTVISSGHSLPRIFDLDALVPMAAQPWPETELERVEGMRVRVADGIVTGPTDQYGDAVITASGHRLFREPGIVYPGLPNLPVWDGNPEAFELDPDALGGDHVDLAAGTRISAVGVLAYVFGDYQLWPTTLDIVATPQLPVPASVVSSNAITIASQNLLRLARSGGSLPYADRLDKLSLQLREVLGRPDIIAVQEVDSLPVLEDLADRLAADEPGLSYRAYLVEGNDPSGIDVGFLVRDTVVVGGVEQIGKNAVFTWDGSRLHDRPPLVVEAVAEGIEITVVVVHLKSLGGVDDPGSNGERVRRKRFEQAEWLAEWVQDRQNSAPDENLVIVGDFNAFGFSDGFVDVVGQITGDPDPRGALLSAPVTVDPPLVDAVVSVPAGARYSYVYRGSAEVLDHALVNRNAASLARRMSFGRGNADAPASAALLSGTAVGSSDHDGFVLSLAAGVRSSGGRRRP